MYQFMSSLILEKLHLAGARDVALGPGGAHGLARAWLGGAPSVESGGFFDDFLEEKFGKIWENYGKYRKILGNHGNIMGKYRNTLGKLK